MGKKKKLRQPPMPQPGTSQEVGHELDLTAIPGLDALGQRFITQMGTLDKVAQVTLKGHLVIEEALTAIIGTFTFHPEQLERVNLPFFAKVAIARALSLDEHENRMWDLILALNTLRNDLAHAIDSPKRHDRLEAVRTLCREQVGGEIAAQQRLNEQPDEVVVSFAAAFGLGFLGSFLREAQRFRTFVDEMDHVINPHRHKNKS